MIQSEIPDKKPEVTKCGKKCVFYFNEYPIIYTPSYGHNSRQLSFTDAKSSLQFQGKGTNNSGINII
jgi:hypothetical protein